MRFRARSSLFLIFILALSAPGCETTPDRPPLEKDGRLYGVTEGAFRHRWWNFYERGLSFAEGAFYPEALADLATAVDGRDRDQRMARTYGMHFIDYFPHREMGVIHYLRGEYGKARRELTLSLEQAPTAKAGYYLDRTRKAILEDRSRTWGPPTLSLEMPDGEIWTRADPVVIEGAAEDEAFISAVVVNGKPLFLKRTERKAAFREPLDLPQGRHEVAVRARNLVDLETVRRVVVHVDREGPLVTLERLERSGSRTTLRGFLHDAAGVAGMSVGGREVPIPKGREVAFSHSAPMGGKGIQLSTWDRLGNRSEIEVGPENLVAGSSSAWTATLCSDRLPAVGFLAKADQRPPEIRITDWTENQTVYLEKIYLAGRASDEGAIQELTVNRESVLRRRGRHIYFNHLAELSEGENTISIEARDEAGNLGRREIRVTRKIPQALRLSERLSVSVLPFEQKGAVSDASFAYLDGFIGALVERNRFRVVERARLDAILREQKLSATALIDPDTAVRMGKLAAAQSIITGSIIETHTGIEIVGRMIDTQSAEILAVEDVYDEEKDLRALATLAKGMALKFHLEFPLVGGIVVMTKGDAVFTDLGEDKTALNRRLIVYREDVIQHPVTGKILGADNTILGTAMVRQVMADMSKAEVIQTETGDIRKLDKVITQ